MSDVSVTLQRGIGQTIYEALVDMTDNVDGVLTNKDNFYSTEIESLQEGITRIDGNLDLRRTRMEAQFLAMEKTIASLQTQEQFIAGQISASKIWLRRGQIIINTTAVAETLIL